MSIVAIMSRHDRESAEIAGYTASRLDYRLVLMEDLVRITAEASRIPEGDLSRALKDFSMWDRFLWKKKLKHIARLEQKLCELMAGNEVVFCGHLGYPIFHEISHVLKVMVLASPEAGIASATQTTVSGAQAVNRKAKWFNRIYRADMEDPHLYDLTLNLAHMDTKEGADIIINTLQQNRFRPMTYSMNCMCNLELACQIRSALLDRVPDVEVKTHGGTAYVYSRAFRKSQQQKAISIKQAVMQMQGVNYVEVCDDKSVFDSM
jgi:cytidylate kinase